MNRTRRRLLGIVATLAAVAAPAAAREEPATQSPALQAETWRPVEIIVHAAQTYSWIDESLAAGAVTRPPRSESRIRTRTWTSAPPSPARAVRS